MTRPGTGEKGAILRRDGLYSSQIVDWLRARDTRELGGRPGMAVRSAMPMMRTAAPAAMMKGQAQRRPR